MWVAVISESLGNPADSDKLLLEELMVFCHTDMQKESLILFVILSSNKSRGTYITLFGIEDFKSRTPQNLGEKML